MGNAQVKPDVTIVGGGMITGLQILPSIYQLQRLVRDGCLLVRIRGCDEIFAPREVQEQASDGIAWP
ncbi:MAG: hypothetical protein IIB71_06965 [Proteobacteria bacterium]|nr:hypothetical protein [Pseudomonadota bacterium]